MSILIVSTSLAISASAADAPEIFDSADLYITFENGSYEDTKGNYAVTSECGDVPAETKLVDGKFGSAAHFVSSMNYLTVNDLKFDMDSFSIALWAYIDEFSGDPCLFSNQNWDSISNLGFSFAIDGFGDGFRAAGCTKGSKAFSIGTAIDTTCEWMHLVLVMDRETGVATMYVNGEPYRETADISGFTGHFNGAYSFKIGEDGAGDYNTSCTFSAYIDEFIVFKSALTAEDVKAICEYDPTAPDEPEETETDAPDETLPEPKDPPKTSDEPEMRVVLIIGIAATIAVIAALLIFAKKKS